MAIQFYLREPRLHLRVTPRIEICRVNKGESAAPPIYADLLTVTQASAEKDGGDSGNMASGKTECPRVCKRL
jgi:hypothetical protein